MITLSVSAKIWAKTVFLNAFFWGVGALFAGDIFEVFKAALYLFGGFVVTLPVLMVMVPLVNISTILPYGINARTAWLAFYFIVLIILFYGLYSKIANDEFYYRNWRGYSVMGTTIAALLVAVITTRKSLVKLFT